MELKKKPTPDHLKASGVRKKIEKKVRSDASAQLRAGARFCVFWGGIKSNVRSERAASEAAHLTCETAVLILPLNGLETVCAIYPGGSCVNIPGILREIRWEA